MKPHELKRLIDGKRRWSDPIPSEDAAKGFKGWYSSKYLPHFDFPHKRQYLTYRLADSLPSSRRDEWQALMALDDDLERQRELERYLDLGHGACHLREPRIAELVQENLWHHDGEHYRLLAWVVMPNHVHVLVEVRDIPLHKILHAWKGYTANAANKILGRRGHLLGERLLRPLHPERGSPATGCAIYREQSSQSTFGSMRCGLALE